MQGVQKGMSVSSKPEPCTKKMAWERVKQDSDYGEIFKAAKPPITHSSTLEEAQRSKINNVNINDLVLLEEAVVFGELGQKKCGCKECASTGKNNPGL